MKKLLCCLRGPGSEDDLDPPSVAIKITRGELEAIIRDQLRIKSHIHTADANYGLLKDKDVERFLARNQTDAYSYQIEGFDCDDFSDVLLGRAKEWYHGAHQDCGAAIGMLWGDIRKDSAPDVERRHAVNFYVNEKREVWLIEPQTDGIFKLNNASEVTFVKI